MSEAFKKKLFTYMSDQRGFDRAEKLAEYRKMIGFGAMGELEDDYYLFLYRDSLRQGSGHYGAVVFINRADGLGKPVRVYCLETVKKEDHQGIKENHRPIYVRTALFFLKNEFQNTMAVTGGATQVFMRAKDKIEEELPNLAQPLEELETFNFDVQGQEVQYREIETKQFKKVFESKTLAAQLTLLEQGETAPAPEDPAAHPEAHLGLSLRINPVGFTEKRSLTFLPVLVPIKGGVARQGNPRRLTPGECARYDWVDLPEELEPYLHHFSRLEAPEYNDIQRTKILNRLYFPQLAETLFHLPEHLVFCQLLQQAKGFNSLEVLKFRKMGIRFAPSFRKETIFSIRLTFYVQVERPGENGMETEEVILDAGDDYVIRFTSEGIYLFFTTVDNRHYFACAEEPRHFERLFRFLEEGKEFYLYNFEEISEALKVLESEHVILEPDLMGKFKLSLRPAPVMHILPEDALKELPERIELRFDYRGEIKNFLDRNPDKEVFTYDRDTDFEGMCRKYLKTDPLLKEEMGIREKDKFIGFSYVFKRGDFIHWLMERGALYLDRGFRIYAAKWKRFVGKAGGRIGVNLLEEIDWLEFRPTVHLPGAPEGDPGLAVDQVDFDSSIVIDKKGTLHLLGREEIEKLKDIYTYGEPHGDALRIPSGNHILIDRLYDKRMEELPGLKSVLEEAKRLRENFETIGSYPLSRTFNGKLREYQQAGFNWLRFLREYGFSGCLADDMGLGKTVQTLALLQTLKTKRMLKTSLLLAPVSAIPNWEAEIEKFAPGLTYRRHLGTGRDKSVKGWKKVDLLISSYGTTRNDVELFREFQFDYIILDESQAIKNHNSLVSKAVKVLRGRTRLALSGTPIENNTMELWSLFDYMMPRYLGSRQWFQRQYASPIEKDKSSFHSEMLKKMIFPFVLRRKKEEVETELPEKTEIVSRLQMGEEQQKLYSSMAEKFRDDIGLAIDEQGVGKSSIKIFEAMLRLRQVCLFPGIVHPSYGEIPSAKFDHFTNLLEDILAEGHKVLVFSQFVETLKILRGHLDGMGVDYSYLDGSMKVDERGENVRRFQEEEERRVFLLSLKAGGTALNLTAADYVIIFDPWWNPAVEAQAIDRSHRIGQTRKVIVYKMVVQGSIEEKMLRLQEAKQELVENLIVSDSKSFKDLGKQDILSLF